MKDRINVSKCFLPNQEEYNSILKSSWDKNWITNRGDLVLKLEHQITTQFNINHIIATTNGTLPIQIAIKALGLTGDIITTPFSYVATTSSIVWEHCNPVFVDIDPDYLTIDEAKIADKITPQTSAILVTHVFGNPCNIDAIQQIANQHNLKVIYDAAHCFGVDYKGQSIFNYGDVSTCSFHATKIFHTGEGGAIFCNDDNLYNTLYHHHNFGHKGTEDFHGLGINAKMSELQAAMGLAVLPYFDDILKRRKALYNLYLSYLKDNASLTFQRIRANTNYNYAYFPVIFDSEDCVLKVINALEEHNIFPRRYFYPSLDNLPYVNTSNNPISNRIAKQILCLPLYYDLSEDDVTLISKIILKNII